MARLIHIRLSSEDEEQYVYEFYQPTLTGGKEKRGSVSVNKEHGKTTVITVDDLKLLNSCYVGRVLFVLHRAHSDGKLKPVMDWIS